MGTRQYYRINQKLELSLGAFKWSFQSVGWEHVLSEMWCICTGYFQERKMHLSLEREDCERNCFSAGCKWREMGSSPWPIPADAVSGTGASRIEGGLEVAARDLCFGHPQAFPVESSQCSSAFSCNSPTSSPRHVPESKNVCDLHSLKDSESKVPSTPWPYSGHCQEKGPYILNTCRLPSRHYFT